MDLFRIVIEQMKKFSKDASSIQDILRQIEEREDDFPTDGFLELAGVIAKLENDRQAILEAVALEKKASGSEISTLLDVSSVIREDVRKARFSKQLESAKILIDELSEEIPRLSCPSAPEILEDLRGNFSSLCNSIFDSSTEEDRLTSLLGELQHYAELITLVDQRDNIDDEELVDRAEALKGALGKGIHAKLLFGKLFLESEGKEPTPPREKRSEESKKLSREEIEHSADEKDSGGVDIESIIEDKESESTDTSVIDQTEQQEERKSAIQDSSIPGELVQYEDLIPYFLEQGKYGLAYNAAVAFEKLSCRSFEGYVWSDILKALAISNEISEAGSPLINDVKTLLEKTSKEIEKAKDKSERNVQRIISTASLLKPFFMEPTSFTDISVEFSGCDSAFQQSIHELSQSTLSKHLLSDFIRRKGYEEELKTISDKASEWHTKTKNSTKSYRDATKVLKASLKEDGLLSRILKPVIDNDGAKIDEVRTNLDSIGDEADINEFIKKEMKNAKGKPVRDTSIPPDLVQKFIEGKSYAEEWIKIQDDRKKTGCQHSAFKVFQDLDNHSRENIQKLGESIETCNCPGEKTAKLVLRNSLIILRDLLAKGYQKHNERSTNELLNLDLLYTDLPLDLDLSPAENDPLRILQSLSFLKEYWPTYGEAVRKRLHLTDIMGTRLLLKHRNLLSKEDVDDAPLQSEISLAAKRAQENSTEYLTEYSNKLEQALNSSITDPEERKSLIGTLSKARNALEQESYYYSRDAIDKLEMRLDKIIASLANDIRTGLEESGIDLSSMDYLLIEERLAEKDLATAIEYRDKWQRGEPLEISLFSNDELESFFPLMAEQISLFLQKKPNPEELLNALERTPKSVFGVMIEEEEELVKDNLNLMRTWYDIKYKKRFENGPIEILLTGLGFQEVELGINSRDKAEVEFKCREIAERDICPIPSFGSFANGKYRIVGSWRDNTPGDLIDKVGDTSGETTPTLLFCFDELSNNQRLQLSKHSRARKRTFIVIDEIMMIFLLSRSRRLSTLFKCSLPFTFLQPYTRSGELPPEMFFGREAEITSLIKPNGPSFVYGGRQLGKTALMHAVKRRFRDETIGRYALYIDLQAYRVGIGRDYKEDFWSVVADTFNRSGPIKLKYNREIEKQFTIKLLEWIEISTDNKIILLLDEVDDFLKNDAENPRQFEITSFLKGLMQKTNNRFKVIFAGLHNVVRTMQYCNQPLANFGDPICVSAMLNAGEWKEAKALIEIPMATNGFKFQSAALSSRILSRCSYYPALIQTFCSHLLKKLNSSVIDNIPRVITSEDIDSVLRDQNINDSLLSSFALTLQLDERYEFLAYIAAYEIVLNGADLSKGISLEKFKEDAEEFWPQLMKEQQNEDILPLLNEMIGLGIMKEVDNSVRRFTLRNENILSLLGSHKQIEDKMLHFSEREIKKTLDLGSHRVSFPGDQRRISPLTFLQNQQIFDPNNLISVFFGSKASGIEDIPEFLTRSLQGEKVLVITTNEIMLFKKRVVETMAFASTEKTRSLIVVPSSIPWTKEWIDEARQLIGSKWPNRGFRAVFLGDYSSALSSPQEFLAEQLSNNGVVVSTLKPVSEDATEKWLQELGIVDTKKLLNILRDSTGFWPTLMQKATSVKSKRVEAMENHLLELEGKPIEEVFPEEDLLSMLNIKRLQTIRVLKTLMKYREPNEGNLSVFASETGLPIEEFRRYLTACEIVGVVSKVKGTWRIDDFASKIVAAYCAGE